MFQVNTLECLSMTSSFRQASLKLKARPEPTQLEPLINIMSQLYLLTQALQQMLDLPKKLEDDKHSSLFCFSPLG